MIRALGLKDKVKIADDWEEMPHIVTEIPIKDIPVYKVRQEDGKGRTKTLQCNQILPFTCLPSEPLLVAPPALDWGYRNRSQVQATPPLSEKETESESSEIDDSTNSADETRSAEPNRNSVSGQPAKRTPTKQQKRRSQRTRKPPDRLTFA